MSILPGITDDSFAPGFDFMDSGITATTTSDREFSIAINPMEEVLFEIDVNDYIKLTVKSGIVEIYGTELANDMVYKFTGAMKFAAFSFKGAEIFVQGSQSVNVKSLKEPLMNIYLSLHLTLENQRSIVSQLNHSISISKMTGPKVLVIGAPNSGKSTLARTLCAYGLKFDRQVMLVNLDPRTPIFVPPGAITATPISDLFNVENVNFGETETTGSNFYHPKQPLVMNFGLENANSNLSLYNKILSGLSDAVFQRAEKDLIVCNSGIIVDTPSNLPDEVINSIIEIFKISIVIAIDKSITLDKKDVKLITINKSANIVEQSDQYIRQIQQRTIREYFYGIEKLSLSPYTITVNYSDFKVYKPLSLPKDEEGTEVHQEFFTPVEINSSNINNSIMSIPKQQDFISCHGFVCVLSCDDEKNKCRILLPTPSNSLPNNEFLLTDFRYYE